MTLFFNLNLLEKQTKGDYTWIVEALRKCYNKQYLPKTRFEKYPVIDKLEKGSSFLLNAGDLFSSKADIMYKALYIRLAGRRDYNYYSMYGQAYLDLSFFPDLHTPAIQHNTLLELKDSRVYFKYEHSIGNTKNGD